MRKIPDDPLAFIQQCVLKRNIHWTYHVNMRLAGRYLTRDEIMKSIDSYEIIEAYPEDKYMPSYLVLAETRFHILFAVDVEGDNVRMVTAYRPDKNEWESNLKTRRK